MLDSLIGRGQNGSNGRDKVGLGSIRRPVIGLALGGGAARGLAHIGIIRTLVAHGIVPNVVVGTSIGAVVGGAYAAGRSWSISRCLSCACSERCSQQMASWRMISRRRGSEKASASE